MSAVLERCLPSRRRWTFLISLAFAIGGHAVAAPTDGAGGAPPFPVGAAQAVLSCAQIAAERTAIRAYLGAAPHASGDGAPSSGADALGERAEILAAIAQAKGCPRGAQQTMSAKAGSGR